MSDALYRELILEECKHPRNKGVLAGATHAASKSNPSCGDRLRVTLRVADGKITDVRFDGAGCAISQAAASLFTDHIKGKPVADVENMDEREILSLLGIALNPMRMKCAVLILRAVDAALRGEKTEAK